MHTYRCLRPVSCWLMTYSKQINVNIATNTNVQSKNPSLSLIRDDVLSELSFPIMEDQTDATQCLFSDPDYETTG